MYCFEAELVAATQTVEALAIPGRGNVLVAHTTANRGQRERYPSHVRGFAIISVKSKCL